MKIDAKSVEPKPLPSPTGDASGIMFEMNSAGDSRIMWNRNNRDEVDGARAHFDSLRKKGYAAYKAVGERGDRGEVIRDFDPTAERIIMVPPVSGGLCREEVV